MATRAVGRAASRAALTSTLPTLSMKSEAFIVFIVVLLIEGVVYCPLGYDCEVKIVRFRQSLERCSPRS